MTEPNTSDRLKATISDLRGFGVVPRVAIGLKKRSDELAAALLESVIREVPAYTDSGNPDVVPELQAHLLDHAREIGHLLSGLPPRGFDFVHEHAKRRAQQKFPLDAVLASYNCLHRRLVDWIRDAALEAADESAQLRRVVSAVSSFVLEYSATVGARMTAEYVTQTRRVAEAEGDRRSELFRILLEGFDESDARAAQLLRRAGYLEQRQSYCIVVARSVNPREMENTARAERMADAVGTALNKSPLRSLVGIHENLVVAIIAGARRLSGWTALHASLGDRAYPQLRTVGPAALIGVSNDAPSTSHIPGALNEARHALDFASVGERVMSFSAIPFRNMLVRVAAEQMRATLPDWVPALLEADNKARGALTATLRAYADADMNALKTAKSLSLHPNTIYARMQKIADITGRNPLAYNALTELLLATDCAALQKGSDLFIK
tara:strand:+ start:3616 stop:4932 length:1317 start_codon:yes stop_codon:yes gene_type:complete